MNVQQTRLFLYSLKFVRHYLKQDFLEQNLVFRANKKLFTADFSMEYSNQLDINLKILNYLEIDSDSSGTFIKYRLAECVQELPEQFKKLQAFAVQSDLNPFDKSPLVKNVRFFDYPDSIFESYIFDDQEDITVTGVLSSAKTVDSSE
ncbi:hypothetical protein [Loigolactobacillus bifermentans]|nr:hypothetical protein [Loigolactobacillus bifermentans]QGG59104.1 hypothetical protein LB003_00750 [Loigolactobacillus bifermentans]